MFGLRKKGFAGFQTGLKFKLRSASRNRIMRMLSDDGSLQVSIKRISKNGFVISAGCDGEAIFEMDTVTLNVGDVVQIDDIQSRVNFAPDQL